MSILICAYAHVPGPNSATVAVESLIQSVHSQVDAVTLKAPGQSHMERVQNGRLFRVPVEGGRAARRAAFCRAVKRQFDSQPYRAVQVRGPLEGLALLPLRESHNFKLVYEVADLPRTVGKPVSSQAWLDGHRELAQNADAIIVPSITAANAAKVHGASTRLHIIPPGVNIDRYDASAGIPQAPYRILYLGRFGSDRDLETLLEAVSSLVNECDVEVLLVGEPSPDTRAAWSQRIQERGLSHAVRVRGVPTPRALPRLISSCHLGVVPAAHCDRFEVWGDVPQSLLEFMACRRPVVAANLAPLREIVSGHENGLLYTPGDSQTLREAIAEAIQNDELRSRIVTAAYERVRGRFSASRRRLKVSTLFQTLLPEEESSSLWRDSFMAPSPTAIPAPATPVQSHPIFRDITPLGIDLSRDSGAPSPASANEWRFEFQDSPLDTAEMGHEERHEPDTRISRPPPATKPTEPTRNTDSLSSE